MIRYFFGDLFVCLGAWIGHCWRRCLLSCRVKDHLAVCHSFANIGKLFTPQSPLQIRNEGEELRIFKHPSALMI